MKRTSGDGENESAETKWPRVPKIGGFEFEQCVAVAQLALKLCELQKMELQNKWEAEDKKYAHDIQKAVTESEKELVNEERNKQMGSRIATLAPQGFLAMAWQLIGKASEYALRAQTEAEYLAARGGSYEVAENIVGRILSASRVPFQKVCNPKRNKGDIETIYGVSWKVFTTERGFDGLFWAYWCDIGEKWKNGDQEIGTMLEFDTKGKPTSRVNFYSEAERKRMAARAHNTGGWKRRGEMLLKKWKHHGVPRADFVALARFRRERDKRAQNLPKKRKRKRRSAGAPR